MTDKLIEKIADAMSKDGNIIMKGFTPSYEDAAQAAISAIKANPELLVKPLEWWSESLKGTRQWAGGTGGSYAITKCDDGYEVIFGIEIKKLGKFEFETEAKEAAQAHHTARVLSLLNLEVE